jgi:hypothetical protein
MARIRTIKPDFFRHELLQDLEIANPGKYPMMVFQGLWGHCDSKGRFEWRPRQLKLDILPFIPFDMAETLAILAAANMVKRYVVDGKMYGEIPTFEKHQRLSGKELTDGEKHPEPIGETTVKQPGSVGEILESQEGKGREEEEEREQEGEGKGERRTSAPRAHRLPNDFALPNDWITAAQEIRPDWTRLQQITDVFAIFRDHWLAKSGKDAAKTDWLATWRNWCRREKSFSRDGPAGHLTAGQRRAAVTDKSISEWLGDDGRQDHEAINGECEHAGQ